MKENVVSRRTALRLGLAAAAASTSLPAFAQTYPNRPITLMIGFAPGGPSDVMARFLSRKLEQELKQSVIVDNRAGAAGNIAAQLVARMAPDGYTLMLGSETPVAINVSLYKNLGFDPEKDFEPIGLIGTLTHVLYTHPSVPAKTLPELIALIKANPGKYNYGTGGVGTPGHLAAELLKMKTGIDLTHVPFRGTGPALQAVVSGHVQMGVAATSPLMPHIQSNAAVPLAVTMLKRTSVLPHVPTFAESGFPGFEVPSWHGLLAPAGLPKDVLATLSRALQNTIKDAEFQKQVSELGVELVGGSPEDFRAYIKSEIAKMAEIIKASGAKVE
jgi:tripartite-type tricarboxylate transporter receptor subunit TctC